MLAQKTKLYFFYLLLVAAAATFTTGCDDREEVLDVETPEGEVEVYRDDEGNVDVERDY